jgi:prevent-host-death family protein
MRERLRRKDAWEQIKQLMAEGTARNADLTQEEADALADEIGDEAKRRVAIGLRAQETAGGNWRVSGITTVSATEAKNRLGTIIGRVSRGEDDVVIENHGKPTAVLISYELYRELREAQDRLRRREAMDALWRLRDEVRARNQDLTEEEADAIAEDVGREAIANVMARARRRKVERSG